MDNDSLKHEARTRQSHPEALPESNNKEPNSGHFCDILQGAHYSITFNASEWRLFWRLLNVSSMLADEILDHASNSSQPFALETVRLWEKLSDQLASVLKKDACEGGEEDFETR